MTAGICNLYLITRYSRGFKVILFSFNKFREIFGFLSRSPAVTRLNSPNLDYSLRGPANGKLPVLRESDLKCIQRVFAVSCEVNWSERINYTPFPLARTNQILQFRNALWIQLIPCSNASALALPRRCRNFFLSQRQKFPRVRFVANSYISIPPLCVRFFFLDACLFVSVR